MIFPQIHHRIKFVALMAVLAMILPLIGGTMPATALSVAAPGTAGRAADSLRLTDVSDRAAFRRWFTFLAEYQAFTPPAKLPAEIKDCSALLRFAYREALWKHDDAWLSQMRLEGTPLLPAVKAYQLPHTSRGARIFRVSDAADSDSYAEFADARTLKNLNSHLLGRDMALAHPGDLIFYRQLEQHSPFHSMVFVGPSHFPDAAPAYRDWVVYHTGPIGHGPGQVRRLRLIQLLKHPDARWRPVRGNPNFLGVYRWNILRDDQ